MLLLHFNMEKEDSGKKTIYFCICHFFMCSQFVSNVQGNQERATNIILNNELLLLKYVSSNTVTELRSSPPPFFWRLQLQI